MPQSYTSLAYHIVFSTRERRPMLPAELRPRVFAYIGGILRQERGALLSAGGTENHVHLAISVAPTILISELIGQLKGSSSHETNKQFGRKLLQWQDGSLVTVWPEELTSNRAKWIPLGPWNQRK